MLLCVTCVWAACVRYVSRVCVRVGVCVRVCSVLAVNVCVPLCRMLRCVAAVGVCAVCVVVCASAYTCLGAHILGIGMAQLHVGQQGATCCVQRAQRRRVQLDSPQSLRRVKCAYAREAAGSTLKIIDPHPTHPSIEQAGCIQAPKRMPRRS